MPNAGESVIHVGVVEDDAVSRDRIVGMLARYQSENSKKFHVSTFDGGRELLVGYRSDIDLLLLDIEMEPVDGMTAARRIRKLDRQVIIVFITNSAQYAVSGYEVAALSYLLKPVAYVAFAQELDRSIEQLQRRPRTPLLVSSDGETHRVDVEDLLYLESVKHRVVIHATDRDYSMVGSLKTMEAELQGSGFVRCNSGYLVNLRHVVGVQQQECVLRGGTRLLISRPRRRDFLQALADYIGSERGLRT